VSCPALPCREMGVPFNFTCSGVGIYVCSRCGFELFSSEDKVQETDTSRPNFTKAINLNSLLRLSNPNSSQGYTIICGKCKIPVGNESIANTRGGSMYDVRFQSLHFVPTKRCSVPISFLF